MSDGDILQAVIAADPNDHTVKLARADWLDENGRHDEAESLRTQVELMGMVWSMDAEGLRPPRELFGPIQVSVMIPKLLSIATGTVFGPITAITANGCSRSSMVMIDRVEHVPSRKQSRFFAMSVGKVGFGMVSPDAYL